MESGEVIFQDKKPLMVLLVPAYFAILLGIWAYMNNYSRQEASMLIGLLAIGTVVSIWTIYLAGRFVEIFLTNDQSFIVKRSWFGRNSLSKEYGFGEVRHIRLRSHKDFGKQSNGIYQSASNYDVLLVLRGDEPWVVLHKTTSYEEALLIAEKYVKILRSKIHHE